MHKYPIKYQIELGEFSKEQLNTSEDTGGCDNLGIISVMGEFGKGSLSAMIFGIHANGHIWEDKNWFQIF